MKTFEFKDLQLINGEFVSASTEQTWDLINPATEELIKKIPFGNDQDAKNAIRSAEASFSVWATTPAYERAKILIRAASKIRDLAEELATITTEESGKPLSEAKGEWVVGADLIEWFAEEGKRSYGRTVPSRTNDRRLTVTKSPVGVVGAITAWNFPVYNTARSWAAALSAGCSVVARPSEYTPRSAMALAQILHDSGLPPGCLNLISGDPVSMGRELLENPVVKKISFTGSVRVGEILMDGASKTHTKLALELGGNAPVIISDSVDVKKVAKSAIGAKFRNCGQVCISPQRFIVHKNIAGEFKEVLLEELKTIKIGNGFEVSTTMGPLINATQKQRVKDLIKDATISGDKIISDNLDVPEKGYFVSPAIVEVASLESPLITNEIFGPVMPITVFEDYKEAIEIANNTPYGLAAYIWDSNLDRATAIAEKVESGMIAINCWNPQGIEVPFGGVKKSGLGRECGSEGLDEYLEEKLIAVGTDYSF